MTKEPGQIAYEAALGFLAVTYHQWAILAPDVKAWYARVEAAVRAAALEEAAKAIGSRGFFITKADAIRTIRALSPSPAAPSIPVASDQSEPPPGSAGQG